jgi:hypothetical protein
VHIGRPSYRCLYPVIALLAYELKVRTLIETVPTILTSIADLEMGADPSLTLLSSSPRTHLAQARDLVVAGPVLTSQPAGSLAARDRFIDTDQSPSQPTTEFN